jgi:two-component system NtrC family sensor kinase
MLHDDREALEHTVRDVGSEFGIQSIRIFNNQGRLTLSTLEQPANHSFLVTRDINNGPECSNAACHVHPANQKKLGVIHASLSLDTVEAQMSQNATTLSLFLVVAIVVGCVAAIAFMWLVVYRPVKELMKGTHRVAGGDFDYRLPVHSADELGDLAESFNKMTGRVAGVQSRIEEEVRRKTAELEQVYKSLLASEKMASIGKLAATVAHEINNPLFGILTYSRLVGRDLARQNIPNRDELIDQLQTIERESKRCGDLVKNLLTFSRQAPSHREPNDYNTIVHRAAALVKHKLDLQSVELHESLARDLPRIDCDANQIQQVALILMVNAAEAMPRGGELGVSTERDATARERILLTVKDTGSGIPEDVLPHIFDPFFTTKQDPNRTGLGLAVARSIVEQHGGEISVASRPGAGTEFTVSLPVGAEAAAAKSPATPETALV